MALASIRLQNFRSYSDESFEFEPGVNIVVGPNASGKTNLLEAVLVIARSSSYRAKDIDLIKFNKPWARVDSFFDNQARLLKLNKNQNKAEKTFEIDNKPFKRLNLERTLPVVFFEPNHLQFITRGPEQRREYIDDLLERSAVGYKALLASYRRTLAQRNALLKHSPSLAQKQLFAWNIRLSELGSQVAEARSKTIKDINKTISRTYESISQKKSKAELKYESHFPVDRYASRFLSKLDSSAAMDLERGFTVYGPHREDISFYLNKQIVGQTASRGETRSLVLALKIFELKLIGNVRGQKPIFLLDDVFSELDSARRQALVAHLENYQTIITTTDAEAIIQHFMGAYNILPLHKEP